jgi:hypothetical protein
LTLYQTHPTLSIAVLAWPALVIAQGVMLWVLQRPVFRRVVPIGPTGYRLISSLTHPYAAAWKIAWLKYKQPVLASEHAYLFDERDPSSLYATISISKTVWLDRLDPSLPHQKVILVNEKNANTLMQVISLPHELFHLKFFHIEYVPKGLLGIVMNPIIFLIDEIVYFPSAVIAFAMLPFFVLYDAGYRLRSMARHWAYHEILGPDLRRYLADYRDPDLGTKYTPAMIDYLNSDPDVVNSRTHEIVRLSTLIDGLSWRAALLAIIQALPPIHMASALPFDRFNKLTVEHANPALGGAGVLPQPESNIVPLSEGTDRPITDLTKSDLKEGRRLGRAAMSAGAWAIVLNVAGEGRRWVANSIRIPGFMTKAFSLSFGLNYGQGLKNAMSMGLNSLSRRIPEDGVVRIEIMSQDLNHTFVQDALAWDPELELNSERMKITVDPLRGVPSWHPEGGVKWIEPQALQIDGSEYRLLTRPPGALSSFVTLLANGRLLEWAEAGVLQRLHRAAREAQHQHPHAAPGQRGRPEVQEARAEHERADQAAAGGGGADHEPRRHSKKGGHPPARAAADRARRGKPLGGADAPADVLDYVEPAAGLAYTGRSQCSRNKYKTRFAGRCSTIRQRSKRTATTRASSRFGPRSW